MRSYLEAVPRRYLFIFTSIYLFLVCVVLLQFWLVKCHARRFGRPTKLHSALRCRRALHCFPLHGFLNSCDFHCRHCLRRSSGKEILCKCWIREKSACLPQFELLVVLNQCVLCTSLHDNQGDGSSVGHSSSLLPPCHIPVYS